MIMWLSTGQNLCHKELLGNLSESQNMDEHFNTLTLNVYAFKLSINSCNSIDVTAVSVKHLTKLLVLWMLTALLSTC